MERWPFYVGTGTILFGSIWTTYTDTLGAGLIFTMWGSALIIKDAINDLKEVV